MSRQLERNLNVLGALAFCRGFLLIMPIAVPLFQSHGLSMAQVFQLQSVSALVVVALEVPSGFLADWVGRRLTLLVGTLFSGLGFTALWFAQDFSGLVLFEACLGIGLALSSGADVALLYDSAGALDKSDGEQQRVLGRFQAASAWAEGLAAIACGLLLASFEPVVVAQVAVGWLPFVLAWLLVDVPPALAPHEPAVRRAPSFVEIWNHVMCGEKLLRLTFLAVSFWGLATFFGAWLVQKHWELSGIDLVWFGWLWALMNLAVGLGGRYAADLEVRFGPWHVLVVSAALPVAGYLGMAYAGTVGGVLFGVTFFAARGVALVVLRHAFNRRLPARFRATANSLAGFAFRAAFVVTGPIVGAVFDLWGMQVALLLCAAGALALLLGLIVPLVVEIRELRLAAPG